MYKPLTFGSEEGWEIKGKKPIIGITLGNPAGVGPEIIVKALEKGRFNSCHIVVIGERMALEDALLQTNSNMRIRILKGPEEVGTSRGAAELQLIDLNNIHRGDYSYGKVCADSGKASVDYILKAIELALAGKIDAIVTAPISKEAMQLAGYDYTGHTEILAKKTGTDDYAMMLVTDKLKVAHVSTHVSLREACDRVKADRVYRVIKLSHLAMKSQGFAAPKIGVAGLNPHAGENGMFGWEEIEEIIPAIERAVAEGMEVEGPIPPDTIFARAQGGQYDVVVAMYHDQGHIPIKTIGFNYDKEQRKWKSIKGINITLGLPIIRTSVDHGVAFDIAGQGKASESSMMEAVIMAQKLAESRSVDINV